MAAIFVIIYYINFCTFRSLFALLCTCICAKVVECIGMSVCALNVYLRVYSLAIAIQIRIKHRSTRITKWKKLYVVYT